LEKVNARTIFPRFFARPHQKILQNGTPAPFLTAFFRARTFLNRVKSIYW
jgi:hypothetical protein